MTSHRANPLLAALALAVLALAAPAAAAPAGRAERAAGREALRSALQEVLRRGPLQASRVGLYVESLDDGSVVLAHNADELLNPASNVKLVTSAAALMVLGTEYRFETEYLVESELGNRGRVKTLYVRGRGDPSLTTERLWGVVGELFHTGLRDVGDIVVDEGHFDAERTPPGYDQEESDRAYMAPTGAVSLNGNTVGIYLRPGAAAGAPGLVELEPPSDFFTVESTLTTGRRRHRRFSVASTAAGERQHIAVRGVVPVDGGAASVWKKVDHPPLYFGHTLRALLGARGVKVRGRVRLGSVPAGGARLLHVTQSETLDVVLKRLNKTSSNFVAEQLLKTLGAEAHGAPGTFAKGVRVVEAFLEREVGIPRGTYLMKNGSGLNDANRFSAAQLGRLLRHMDARFPLAPEFLSSLGIAGKDGTLKYRFEGSEAVGRLRAKTGTLENVSALSGYVQSVSGERFLFAAMVNDFPGRVGPVVRGLDALGAAVASAGAARPGVALAAAGEGPGTPDALEVLKARVRTYLAFARQRDPRNLGLLRSAWRTEKDPAVRAVVAESLYQSNPQDYLGARALLDSFGPGDEVYGRLRRVALELGVETPGVASVVELAAGGNAEALARLVELAPASGADAPAREELGAALAEVARTAPDELLASLRAAAAPEREAATVLLAQGLVGAGEADHPFWKALRRTHGAADPALAAFARTLESALSLEVAHARAPPLPEAAPSAPAPLPTAESRPGG